MVKDHRKVFEFIKHRCNNLIFKGYYRHGITIDELKHYLEHQDINLTIATQSVFSKLLQEELNQKDINLSLNAVKSLINEAVQNKFLFRWGEENMFLVTQEFLEYIKVQESPYLRFDLEDLDEDTDIKTLECPYCFQQTRFPIDDGHFEVSCEKCFKEFKIITGIIKNIDNTLTKLQQSPENPEPITKITLLINNQIKTINFNTSNNILIDKNDKVSLIFIKGWLFEDYTEFPNKIANLTSSQIYRV